MGRDDGEKEAKRRRGRSSKRSRDASPSSSDSGSSPSPSSASYPSRSPEPRSRSRRSSSSKRKKSSSSSSRRHRHHHKSSGRSRNSRDDDRRRRRRKRRDEERRRRGGDAGDSSGSGSGSGSGSEESDRAEEAREIVRDILGEFPAVAGELRQLLQMIDCGEGIDISGISDKPLVKRLKKPFRSLKLKESANGAYLLAPKSVPTLDVVGPVLLASSELGDNQNEISVSQNTQELPPSNFEVQNKDDITPEVPGEATGKRKPLIEG